MNDNVTNQAFMMRTALMWTVNDLPVYGMALGWTTAGVMEWTTCMVDTQAFHLQYKKACYFDCYEQFLPQDHSYRRNKKAFTKNQVEMRVARSRLTEEQIAIGLQSSVLHLKYR
ncbi:UNVERIFIED_CONTAM: hypothetical protein Slati_1775300 [Sesamum latifolium]|uniref:Uncharacterized protein n=1 Tax=Sesamum latifolium TaxID=2727402 RepID=A0AAW2WZT6_9LAMI